MIEFLYYFYPSCLLSLFLLSIMTSSLYSNKFRISSMLLRIRRQKFHYIITRLLLNLLTNWSKGPFHLYFDYESGGLLFFILTAYVRLGIGRDALLHKDSAIVDILLNDWVHIVYSLLYVQRECDLRTSRTHVRIRDTKQKVVEAISHVSKSACLSTYHDHERKFVYIRVNWQCSINSIPQIWIFYL